MFTDPTGLAYFAVRPLQGILWRPTWLINPADRALNVALEHEQLFFEDNKEPANIGFFNDSELKSESSKEGYTNLDRPGTYDDCMMRKAVSQVSTGTYIPVGNNCQSWADRVRKKYNELMQSAVEKKVCGL
jgi:hypothetical protein